MTLSYKFSAKDRFTIGSKSYRFIKFDAATHDYYFTAEDPDGFVEIIPGEKLSELMASPAWQHDPGYFDLDNRRGGRTSEIRLALTPTRQRHRTVFSHYVAGLLHLEIQNRTATLSDASLTAFRCRLQRQFAENPTDLRRKLGRLRAGDIYSVPKVPGISTLRKHYRIYMKFQGDVLAHKPKQPRVLKMRRAACSEGLAVTQDLIRKALTPETRGKAAPANAVVSAMRALNKQRGAERLPSFYVYSERQIQRMIANLPPFEVACAQLGIDKARHQFSSYLSGLAPVCLLERVEIDDWEVDLITWFRMLGLTELLPIETLEKLPIGRRWICVALDVASRCVLGLRIAAAPSAEEFRKLLEMVISDKTDLAQACGAKGAWAQYGRPMSIAADTGASFIATATTERVTDLNCCIEHAPVKCAELRGTDERFFGTIGRTLMHRLPGHTQSGPENRGDYDAGANACLDDDDLIRILVCYIVDEYHRSPHRGLGGQMPVSKWNDLEKEAGFLQPPVDRMTRCAALGIDINAKLGKQGVLVFGNHYSCDELRQRYAEGRNRDLRVRVDTANLGLVAVAIDEKWVAARPHTRDMECISLSEWEEQCVALRTRFKNEADLSAEYRSHAVKTIRDVTTTARARLRRQQATPFGHSTSYVQHLQNTLFSGFRFREEVKPTFGPAPDGLGQEILPAPDPALPVAVTDLSRAPDVDDENQWDDWQEQPEEEWRLEEEK
ncbi:DDE-type integrase/transposase/recombinase [Pseudogemmobacter blasticus]|uniref:Integrase catalytic domain-containing protein n=1 Tax=Fuscovulum blasticum DSM 2131 TaxID=1188250 RepID=A0A2T4J9B9_FUSBL|nr:DDE-type integrase/transposase/recombinase [Fuscovulum blasticum]PTE14505.1 hypothetical protein C5F44_09005 [Fuscovulum blasticum DSM 2131]